MTQVAVPIAAASPEALAPLAQAARSQGADLVEVRLDTCQSLGADPLACARACGALALPVLATARHRCENGTWQGDEAARGQALAAAAAAGASYVDVELARWSEVRAHLGPLPGRCRLILSYHDFAGLGDNLSGRIAEMRAKGALPKIAITAHDAADLDVVQRLYADADADGRELIAIAMGEHGAPSRQLAGAWGAFLTFARLDGDGGSAPGQPTVKELLEVFHLRRQRRGMPVYGVIGSPIAHSLSPVLHNECFRAFDVPAIYARFRVEDAAAFWRACGGWIQGLSITIPHKAALMPLMDRLDPLARQVGVMNTVFRDQGRTVGATTDATAIAACIAAAGHQPEARVLVLGAGGVAQAAACALAGRGATVAIHNRTHARAVELAARCGGTALDADQARAWPYEVLLNGTAVGMKAPDDTPWPHPHRAGTTVFDTVYTPRDTRLLREARAAGCTVIDGVEMFARQAAEQFELWTSLHPLDLMRQMLDQRFAH
ncbi:MAG: type I 3-dehydroquinate dehydratase [Planctomycetes bacterium]|nr:type I 3-dehydroquinate dehydratase [Planctomycetota bacterium]